VRWKRCARSVGCSGCCAWQAGKKWQMPSVSKRFGVTNTNTRAIVTRAHAPRQRERTVGEGEVGAVAEAGRRVERVRAHLPQPRLCHDTCGSPSAPCRSARWSPRLRGCGWQRLAPPTCSVQRSNRYAIQSFLSHGHRRRPVALGAWQPRSFAAPLALRRAAWRWKRFVRCVWTYRDHF
jgi:hypothetical protein